MDAFEHTTNFTDEPANASLPALGAISKMPSHRLKVGWTQPSRPYRLHEACSVPPTYPTLWLKGRWLERAGFVVGSTARIQVERGRLVIEVIDPDLIHVLSG